MLFSVWFGFLAPAPPCAERRKSWALVSRGRGTDSSCAALLETTAGALGTNLSQLQRPDISRYDIGQLAEIKNGLESLHPGR